MPSRAAQLAALAAAAVFALFGVLGLVATSGRLAFAGGGSHARIAGQFRTSVLLDLVWLALAAAGLVLARTDEGARRYLRAGGIACLLLWLVDALGHGGWLPLSRADDWLHFTAGACLLAASAATSPGAARRAAEGLGGRGTGTPAER